MPVQIQNAEIFHRLHRKGEPVVLFNVCDAGTAKVVADAWAKAITTGSWTVAAAHGRSDGQALPFDLALANLARIRHGPGPYQRMMDSLTEAACLVCKS